jgi:hypothetical protein
MIKLALLLGSLIIYQTQAGIMLEPYLGIALNGKGDLTQKDSTGTVSTPYDLKVNSLSYGARVGFSNLLGLVYGIEYSLQPEREFEITHSNSAFDFNFDGESTHLGLFLGLYIPFIKLRVSYFAKSTLKINKDSTPLATLASGTEFEGNGLGIGAGVSIFPFVALNLDYRSFSYDEATPYPNSADPNKFDASYKEILLSLSVPL